MRRWSGVELVDIVCRSITGADCDVVSASVTKAAKHLLVARPGAVQLHKRPKAVSA